MEVILIGDVKVTIVRINKHTVKIGIEAPKKTRVLRGELERKDDANQGQ